MIGIVPPPQERAMPIVEALQTITGGLGVVKELAGMRKAWDEAEFKMKIAELSSALADAKLALIEAQDDLRMKDNEIAKLRASFHKASETIEHFDARFIAVNGQPDGMPLCSVCFLDGVIIHQTHLSEKGEGFNQCPRCKAKFRFSRPERADRQAT